MEHVLSLSSALGIGLITGVLCGFFFERRANKRTRQQNRELQRELSVLKTTMYSFGRGAHGQQPVPVPTDLAGLVTARALEMQDAGGRLNRRELVAYFLEQGNDVKDVEAAVKALCRAGAAQEDGLWLQLT